MARRSPAVERCVAVLNHLAAHPESHFTLSELSRALEMNKATAHALLGTLAEEQYVLRDPDSLAYSLGPALIAVGTAARATYPAARLAEAPMARLSAELDLSCIASQAIGEEIVILVASGSRRPFGVDIQPGQRMPLVPPLGSVFVAWAGDSEIDRWLAQLGPRGTEADLARYRKALENVRARGYSLGVGGTDDYDLTELTDQQAYRVNHVGAPVFNGRGEVVLALFLIGFQGQIDAGEVPVFARRLVETAGEVTNALGGRAPIG